MLVLVDYQSRLMPVIHDGSTVLAQALHLANIARDLGVTTIGTEQNPDGLGRNPVDIRACCAVTLAKRHFDACADGLLDAMSSHAPARPRDVVIAGCEAHVCLLQTAMGLLDAGRRVWVVAPACGSRDPASHALAMQRLQAAGASIVNTEMMAFEWLRSCDHPKFRQVLQRLK